MSKFYSSKTNGFYDDGVHGDQMPYDAVPISEDEYARLLSGTQDGQLLSSDENGMPVLKPYPSLPEEERIALWRGAAEVSRFQARAALLQAGLLGDIETYMADPATDPFVRIAWQDAQVFKRNSPTVLSLQPLLGLTDGQLDDLFRFAATIEA